MNEMQKLDRQKYKKVFFWFWIYTLLVIIWGAWVRISHSGDGCGDHWPVCQGEFIPDLTQKKTFIEYFHRLMSGAYGLIVIYLWWKLRFLHKKMTLAHSFLILMITEALLGAALVKFNLVTTNDSFLRLIFMSLHQLNSFMLTAVTFLIYKSFDTEFDFRIKKIHILFIIVPITGAIAALSTTLFPSISLFQGIMDDFNSQSHIFIKLRILHPLLAMIIMTSFIIWLYVKNETRLALETFFAVVVGIITLISLSPVYLKISHLLLAHLLWARYLDFTLKVRSTQKVDINT
ncbi:MAG: COX15/CtaA family protein [Pseudobdellovibrio sp.]